MLVYLNEPEFLNLPMAQQDRLRRACADWHEALVQQGHSAGCLRLEPVATATTLREKAGKLILSDGPFAETKEVLAGFVILECRNLDEAIALSRSFPSLPAGFSLELRPAATEDDQRTEAT